MALPNSSAPAPSFRPHGTLLSGAPDLATTHEVLRRFRAHADSLLLVPTATMAEHLRHTSVRAGLPVRPKSIQTLAAFLDRWSPLGAAPEALVHLWLERALEHQRPPRFREVAEFSGVVRALAGLFAEAPAAQMPDDVGRLFNEVERELAARGVAPRHARLKAAAERIASDEAPLPAQILWHGFFKMSAGELRLAATLANRCALTIALPEWSGAERARENLLAGGFSSERVPTATVPAPMSAFRAPTAEREAEEIARRIVEQAASGRPYREMAVIVRSRDPYAPLIEAALARFGIPARGYFTDTLASHPAVQFRAALVRAALFNWDQEVLLQALQMPASGLGATLDGDVQDFAMRRALPHHGWHATASLNPHEEREAGEWTECLRSLDQWAPPLAVTDGANPDRVAAWRSLAEAQRGWQDTLDGAAKGFEGAGPMTLARFWRHVETVLDLEPLRLSDARRDVVHILDAYEARQWSLPIVFVCGLTERLFPKYHREDAIVGDLARRRAGLDTAADLDREERFLFEIAISRATVETVLSYPQFDDAGQETLPSFFLAPLTSKETGPALCFEDAKTRVRPVAKHRAENSNTANAPIQSAALHARLLDRHKTLSASGIDSYLQCPFQFFMRRTLHAIQRPEAPRDRLNALLQGNIIHAALAAWTQMPLLDDGALEDAFEEACHRENVPRTYRTEAVRLELLRHFRAFKRDQQLQLPGWTQRVEAPFEFALDENLSLRGVIDRIETGPPKQTTKKTLVIDYKYSGSDKMKQRIAASEAGDQVQAGVYLLAARHALELKPAGMLFCHLKKGVKWDGWHANIAELHSIGEARTPQAFAELIETAEHSVRQAHQEITGGRVEVAPRDASKCEWCECRDMCRVESIQRTAADAAHTGEAGA